MTTTVNIFATIVLAGAAVSLAANANSADLEVSIEGLRSAEGQARVALHQRVPSASFPDEDGAVAKISRSADPSGVRVVFTGLSPGDYAVAAFHDADGDGELGRNILRIPTEGYGFSNGARGFMGPPSFDDAALTIGSGEERISVVVPIAYPGS